MNHFPAKILNKPITFFSFNGCPINAFLKKFGARQNQSLLKRRPHFFKQRTSKFRIAYQSQSFAAKRKLRKFQFSLYELTNAVCFFFHLRRKRYLEKFSGKSFRLGKLFFNNRLEFFNALFAAAYGSHYRSI